MLKLFVVNVSKREWEKEKLVAKRCRFFLLRFQINVDLNEIPMQEQTCRCWLKAVSMLVLFSRVSTWLFIELLATLILVVLNMFIPVLMLFSSYRNIINFYFSSVALSTSMINCLYMYYLAQTLHSKVLSENNCRAIYYLQTSCIVVLGRFPFAFQEDVRWDEKTPDCTMQKDGEQMFASSETRSVDPRRFNFIRRIIYLAVSPRNITSRVLLPIN